MPAAYSMDLRQRVAAACDAGERVAVVAERFQVTVRFVHKLLQHRRATGSLVPKQGQRGPRAKLAGHEDQLRALVEREHDLTLRELRDRLGVAVSLQTVLNTLRRLGFTRKKNSLRRRATTP